jgi:hypothetical protein
MFGHSIVSVSTGALDAIHKLRAQLLELAKLSSHGPVAKSQDEDHQYVYYRHEHQQTKGPGVTRLVKYHAGDQQLKWDDHQQGQYDYPDQKYGNGHEFTGRAEDRVHVYSLSYAPDLSIYVISYQANPQPPKAPALICRPPNHPERRICGWL